MEEKYVEKIPYKMREMFKNNRLNGYDPVIRPEKPLDEQNLQRKTFAILAMLNLNYWCEDEEERQKLIAIYAENDKKREAGLREKYNPDNIFKKKETIEQKTTETTTALIEYREDNFLKKIINIIKSFFKRKQKSTMEEFMKYREKFDKRILESLKDKIQNYLQSKGLKTVDFIRQNMDSVENLYVEASDTRKLPKMQSRGARPNKPAEIMINKIFIEVDENDKPVNIDKNLRKLIRSQLGHELLHAAARFDGYTGIINNKNNRGLNEGLTQMFTEKIFGYVVSQNSDGYKDYKKIAKILDITFGKDVTLDSYFNHTNALGEKCIELSGDNNFYRHL